VERLRVDWIRCEGYGLCGDYAPDAIELDEWRYPILRPGPIDPAAMNEVQRAIDCCPMKALTLEQTTGDPHPAAGARSASSADPATSQRRRASSRAS
jgi:ferredoxin